MNRMIILIKFDYGLFNKNHFWEHTFHNWDINFIMVYQTFNRTKKIK